MTELIKKIIPSYTFVQYNDDEDVVAFFDAFNEIAQEYLDAFNGLSLPYWPSDEITGYLLDWIALGIYGEIRPAIQTGKEQTERGDYNTIEYNVIPYAKITNYIAGQYTYLPDDYFKRILTWNFYKGDGFQFSIPWLKRRVARFIHGKNGVFEAQDNTFDVGVTVSFGVFTINIPDYGDGVTKVLESLLEQSLVKLPFIYKYNVNITVK